MKNSSLILHPSSKRLRKAEMKLCAARRVDGVRSDGLRNQKPRRVEQVTVINAEFAAERVVGNVVSDIPNVKIVTIVTDGRSDYEARIGSGGHRITISSVRGGVRLRKLS